MTSAHRILPNALEPHKKSAHTTIPSCACIQQIPPERTMALDIIVTLLSAAQASLSVLLTIAVGVGAAQFGFLDGETSRRISQLSVEVFLPLLLLSNIGSEINVDTAVRYLPILIWALLYSFISLFLTRAAVVLFRLPKWIVAAVTFNNTTSLPLLLVQSLSSTGAFQNLLGPDSGGGGAFDRIRSYFLVFAVVINVITFGEGERALTGYKEHGFPFAGLLGVRRGQSGEEDLEDAGTLAESGSAESDGDAEDEPTQATPLLQRRITPLLPRRVMRGPATVSRRVSAMAARAWSSFPDPLKRVLRPLRPFANSTSLGAAAGVFVGLTPPLHRVFFNPMHEGGYFNAWLTTPIKNIGELFVTLQVIVVGVSLSLSIRQRKRNRRAGDIPRGALAFVLISRFVVFPAMSIPIIWSLANYTNILTNDPALWFAMMLMPVGPPAMKLLALADVNDVDEEITMSIARLLTASYAVTPLISFSVVGALRASESVAK
ncbi:hypothetical protein VUR80DRAFT_2338 [Thermomyces stellatus]